MIFGDGFDKYLDVAYFAFIVPNRLGEAVGDEGDLVMLRGRDFLLAYHAVGKQEVGGYVFHRETPYIALGPKERRSVLIKDHGRYDARFLRILETLTDDDPVFHGSFTQVVMPTWYKGRACLVGDAAYCPTPAAGAGASLAMTGAYILVKKLAATNDYRHAFEAYDAHVRPFADKAQKSARGQAKVVVGDVPVPYRLTNAFLRLLPAPLLAFVLTSLHSHQLKMPLDYSRALVDVIVLATTGPTSNVVGSPLWDDWAKTCGTTRLPRYCSASSLSSSPPQSPCHGWASARGGMSAYSKRG